MSLKNKVELISFLDKKANQELGNFFPNGKENEILLKEIKSFEINTSNELNKNIFQGAGQCLTIRNSLIYWRLAKNSQIIIFLVTLKEINSTGVYNLLEEIENQNVIKYLDKQKNLNNVAKQNLQYLIDKHIVNNNEDESINKIKLIKGDLDSIKSDMSKNIKNIVSNIEDSKVLDDKALKIKETSILFSQNANEILKLSKRRKLKNIIIIISALILFSFIIYLIFF